MPNFTVSPAALVFPKTAVQGPVAGLYAAAPTLTFTLKNNSGASVTITGFGFSSSTEGDASTLPAGQFPNSDFAVVPTGSHFPVTVANAASQSFTVTYAPLRGGSGFGDIRSQILCLFAGSKALSNGGQVLNSVGEVIDNQVPQLVTIGVGGTVIDKFDTPKSSPLYWTGGSLSDMSSQGPGTTENRSRGFRTMSSIADLDTNAHTDPMVFFFSGSGPALPTTVNGAKSVTTPQAPQPATYQIDGSGLYGLLTPFINGSPRGGRSYQILVFFVDDTVTMDITVYAVTTGGNVAIKTFPAVTYTNAGGLFLSNTDGLDLEGLSLAVSTQNVTGTSNYQIGAVILG